MRTSNHWISIYTVIMGLATALIWFSQQSINAYWQQTYHQESPLEPLNQYAWWSAGADAQQKLNEGQQWVSDWFQQQSQHWAMTWGINDEIAQEQPVPAQPLPVTIEPEPMSDQPAVAGATPTIPSESDVPKNVQQELGIIPEDPTPQPVPVEVKEKPTEQQVQAEPQAEKQVAKKAPIFVGSYALLHKGDKVFFAGDSLMQGVAPFVQKSLKQQYGIDSINLSKQSTGLSYPSFFDWPATIEKTLNSNSGIKVLIVFLGPNDPWDFPNPNKPKGSYLRFASDEWAEVYAQRIQRILTAANKHGVRVIWLGVPYMKAKKLDTQMDYLDQLLAQQLQKKAIWLPTRELLSNGSGQYTDSIQLNGKTVTLRSKDGIHFTPAGQKRLAEYILQHIQYQP